MDKILNDALQNRDAAFDKIAFECEHGLATASVNFLQGADADLDA